MNDLTNASNVVEYMSQATSEADWNRRCDDVKYQNYGQYPSFWFAAVILSGVATRVSSKWS